MPRRRFTLLVNPIGGTRRGLALLDAVRPIFASAHADLEVHVTTHAGHTTELAHTLDLDRCDGLCLIGGDGTLHEAVNGLLTREAPVTVPLGIIPGGTGNSFLQHFQCLNPLDAARRIVVGHTEPLDAARVTLGNAVTYCVNVIGWGAVVDINRTAERLRRLGPSRYAVATLLYLLRARRRRARLILNGQILEDEFLLATVCNTQFTGKGMRVAPQADSHDGELDAVLVRPASRSQLLTLFRKVFDGSHLSLPFVEHRRVRSFGIECDGPHGLNLDGELKGNTPLSMDVLPSALTLFV